MRGFIPELRIRLHAIDKFKVTLSLCAPHGGIQLSGHIVPFSLNLVAVRLTSFRGNIHSFMFIIYQHIQMHTNK